MPKEIDSRRLERHALFNRVLTLLLTAFGLVAFALYFRPALVGVKPEGSGQYKEEIIWFVTGVFFLLIGSTFYFLGGGGRGG